MCIVPAGLSNPTHSSLHLRRRFLTSRHPEHLYPEPLPDREIVPDLGRELSLQDRLGLHPYYAYGLGKVIYAL